MSSVQLPAPKRAHVPSEQSSCPNLLLDFPRDLWAVLLWWLCSYREILGMMRVCAHVRTCTLSALTTIAGQYLRFPLRLQTFTTRSNPTKLLTEFIFSAVNKQVYSRDTPLLSSIVPLQSIKWITLQLGGTPRRLYVMNIDDMIPPEHLSSVNKSSILTSYVPPADVLRTIFICPNLVNGMVRLQICILNYHVGDITGFPQIQKADPYYWHEVMFNRRTMRDIGVPWSRMPKIAVTTMHTSDPHTFDTIITASERYLKETTTTTIVTIRCKRSNAAAAWEFHTSVSRLTCRVAIAIPKLMAGNHVETRKQPTAFLFLGCSTTLLWWWITPGISYRAGYLATTPKDLDGYATPPRVLYPDARSNEGDALQVRAAFGVDPADAPVLTTLLNATQTSIQLFCRQITDTMIAVVFRGKYSNTANSNDSPTNLLFFLIDLTTNTIALRRQYELWSLSSATYHIHISHIWCDTDPSGNACFLAAVFCSEKLRKQTSCLLRLYNLSRFDSSDPFYAQRVYFHNIQPITPAAMNY